jgi:hypothetical protein
MSKTDIQINDLISKGYCRTSNKYRIISRIDREDWLEVIYIQGFGHKADGLKSAVQDYYEGKNITGFRQETIMYEAQSAADSYRRCLSKDNIENIDPELYKLFPASNDSLVGYCHIFENDDENVKCDVCGSDMAYHSFPDIPKEFCPLCEKDTEK